MTIRTTRRFVLLSAALGTIATLAAGKAMRAVRAGDSLRIDRPWARAAIAGGNSAVYMQIVNDGSHPDRLIGVETELAARAELHRMAVEGGAMRMQPVPAVEIPAGGRIALAPGGLHVMLLHLRRPLREGETLPLLLRFAHAGEKRLAVPVRAAGAVDDGQEQVGREGGKHRGHSAGHD
ncbi:hypothetical protein HRbin40_00378 [bacterium HR40]|nr:hypothetical protein HRbin40_00378 [bacterium HR40]